MFDYKVTITIESEEENKVIDFMVEAESFDKAVEKVEYGLDYLFEKDYFGT